MHILVVRLCTTRSLHKLQDGSRRRTSTGVWLVQFFAVETAFLRPRAGITRDRVRTSVARKSLFSINGPYLAPVRSDTPPTACVHSIRPYSAGDGSRRKRSRTQIDARVCGDAINTRHDTRPNNARSANNGGSAYVHNNNNNDNNTSENESNAPCYNTAQYDAIGGEPYCRLRFFCFFTENRSFRRTR